MKNEEQTTKVSKELSKVSVTHSASKSKLAELEDKSSKEERRLKVLFTEIISQFCHPSNVLYLTVYEKMIVPYLA